MNAVEDHRDNLEAAKRNIAAKSFISSIEASLERTAHNWQGWNYR
jgi:hypothetical protein